MNTNSLLNSYPFKNPNFFSLEGRLNRTKYLLSLLVICTITFFTMLSYPSFGSKIVIVMSIALFFVSIKRLHDIDKSGGFLLLAFFPPLGLALILFLLHKKGTAGSNKYGYNTFSNNDDKQDSKSDRVTLSKIKEEYENDESTSTNDELENITVESA